MIFLRTLKDINFLTEAQWDLGGGVCVCLLSLEYSNKYSPDISLLLVTLCPVCLFFALLAAQARQTGQSIVGVHLFHCKICLCLSTVMQYLG